MNVYDTPEYQSFRREFDEFFCADCRDPSAGEARDFYDLDRLWADGTKVKWQEEG